MAENTDPNIEAAEKFVKLCESDRDVFAICLKSFGFTITPSVLANRVSDIADILRRNNILPRPAVPNADTETLKKARELAEPLSTQSSFSPDWRATADELFTLLLSTPASPQPAEAKSWEEMDREERLQVWTASPLTAAECANYRWRPLPGGKWERVSKSVEQPPAEAKADEGKLYAERDSEALGKYYTRHVEAMTAEGLHQKNHIAAELAHRDKMVDTVRQLHVVAVAGIEVLEAKVKKLEEFKAYVHKRFDDAGIPANPNGPHSKDGCRVGDRLDIALNARAEVLGKVGEVLIITGYIRRNIDELPQHGILTRINDVETLLASAEPEAVAEEHTERLSETHNRRTSDDDDDPYPDLSPPQPAKPEGDGFEKWLTHYDPQFIELYNSGRAGSLFSNPKRSKEAAFIAGRDASRAEYEGKIAGVVGELTELQKQAITGTSCNAYGLAIKCLSALSSSTGERKG